MEGKWQFKQKHNPIYPTSRQRKREHSLAPSRSRQQSRCFSHVIGEDYRWGWWAIIYTFVGLAKIPSF